MAEADWRKNLRYYRKKLGKTQSDVALQLNVKQQTIVGYEKGPTNPSIDDLITITKYLGISISELFTNTDTTGKENSLRSNTRKSPGVKNYDFDDEPGPFSLNEPAPSRQHNFYDHLGALSRIYNEEIADIKARLKALEDKLKT